MTTALALQRKLEKVSSQPTHVWWNGPQDVAHLRDLRELDPYKLWDRDGHVSKCVDKRWLRSGTGGCRGDQFAPNPTDIKWGKKIAPRFAPPKKTGNGGGLDPYGIALHGQMGAPDRNRALVFGEEGSRSKGRFVSTKIIDRDFSRTGSFTNVIGEKPWAQLAAKRPASAPVPELCTRQATPVSPKPLSLPSSPTRRDVPSSPTARDGAVVVVEASPSDAGSGNSRPGSAPVMTRRQSSRHSTMRRSISKNVILVDDFLAASLELDECAQ